jgi:ribosomal-protein-alanine N-acetyltransferase
MRPVKLRPLLNEDLDRVVEIERDTFADPWSKRSFAGMLRQAHIHGIAADEPSGLLIGYALCSVAADEGEVLNIAVAQDERGKGVGATLLAGLLDYLRRGGARQAYLEVRRSNEAAIALYRAAGFRSLGVRSAYYTSPREDALTMALELASPTARK